MGDYPSSGEILSSMGDSAPKGDSNAWADTPAPQAAPPTPAPEQQAAPTPAPAKKEWTLNVNGKDIRTDDEGRIIQWAQQGYNYAQQVEAFKKQQAEYEVKYKGFDRYSEIDQFAKQNPQWWQHVEQAWNSRGQFNPEAAANPEMAQAQQMLQQLIDQKLGPVQEFMTEVQREKSNREAQQADATLRDQMESIRKEYPNLDFAKVDQAGKSLELRVLEHGMSKGIHDFEAAFRDFYWKDAIALERAKAKEEAAKEAQKLRSNGILSQQKVAAPTTPAGQISYNRNGSYGADVQEAIRELGLAL